MNRERAYWIAWHGIDGLGPLRLQRLIEQCGSLEAAWHTRVRELAGLGLVLMDRVHSHRTGCDPLVYAEQWEAKHGPCLTPGDQGYPALLREIPDMPPVLYYRGQLPIWEPAIAIVGTRRASSYGLRWAKKLGYELAQAGFLVVSGLASGIDGAAHQGALESGRPTVAVVGCGVDRCYPPEHGDLHGRIRAQGAILSEHPGYTAPERGFFPQRNRVLAGMTQATLVIEAGEKSGALITARLAVDYGREVFALPGNLDTPQAQGTLSLMNQGAQMVLGIEDLLQKLGHPTAQTPSLPPPELTGLEQQVFGHLTMEPQLMEQLLHSTQLATGDLSAVLLLLELKGLARQLPGLKYCRG